MCQVYSDVTFCTCSDFEIDQVQSLKNYWVLYRFNEALDLVIVGEIMLDCKSSAKSGHLRPKI